MSEPRRSLVPAGEPKVIQIVYVSPDGKREDGPRIEIPAYPAGGSRRR
jgi:hypothetical protein